MNDIVEMLLQCSDPISVEAADTITRLRIGLGFISQLVSDRVPSMIAQATLDGAHLEDEDVAIDVCEGHWRKP